MSIQGFNFTLLLLVGVLVLFIYGLLNARKLENDSMKLEKRSYNQENKDFISRVEKFKF